MHPSATTLYTSPSPSSLPINSINTLIRTHHTASRPDLILSHFSHPSPPKSSLYCLSPTLTLLTSITNHAAPTGGTLLSIGSASGLLEYLLHYHAAGKFTVIGADVAKTNVYLPEDQFIWVPSGKAVDAHPHTTTTTTLFVSYLRRPAILIDYLSHCRNAQKVIIVGPKSEDPRLDPEVKKCLDEWGEVSYIGGEAEGLEHWDQMIVYANKNTSGN